MKLCFRLFVFLCGFGLLLLLARSFNVEGVLADPPVQAVPVKEARTDAFHKAYLAEQAKDYAAAIAALAPAKQGPKDYLVDLRLAWLNNSAADYNVSRKQFEQAMIDAPRAIEPRVGILMPLLSQLKYTDVEAFARQAQTIDRENYYANLRLSYTLRLLNKLPEAEKINQHMIELYPTDANFQLEQALTLGTQRRYEECRKFYKRVLLLSPDNFTAAQALLAAPVYDQEKEPNSDVFRKSYQHEAAKEYADALLVIKDIKPTKIQEYVLNFRLGWLYYMAGNNTDSSKHYEKAVKLAPRAVEPLIGLLLPQLAQGKYDEAVQTARQALKLDKNNYYANMRLANALRMQSKFTDAEKINDKMLELYPSDVTLLLEQALTLTGQKRADDARKLFQQVVLLAPENATAAKALEAPAAASK